MTHHDRLIDKRIIQHELFTRLSAMFAREVPMYDRALLINDSCNRAAGDVLAHRFKGFSISDEQIERTSGERHGAIRIGRPDEFRWVCRFFECFDMQPHNFYDMTSIGAKSQPVIATAFRSARNPDHRVFASLLRTDYFEPGMRERIEALLDKREVFTPRARELIEQSERDGGLDRDDADALINEACEHIFRWKPHARDPELYRQLCDSGYKIAADIACFTTHHLNHLTPNTLCMDLYTAAMRRCLGEIDDDQFKASAASALHAMTRWMDHHAMALHFKHLSSEQINAFERVEVEPGTIELRVERLLSILNGADHDLSTLNHNGFKDYTEGPSSGKLVLLRQDAYRALTEPVEFTRADGTTQTINHTARFGEIEQRFYATTPRGRALYDDCLGRLNARLDEDPDLPTRDPDAFESARTDAFAPIPGTLDDLIARGLVHGFYEPTEKGTQAAGSIETTDLQELFDLGYARVEGLRYEDFLPFSAAGIFASNLNQYGTQATATDKPEYTQADLERILNRPIVHAAAVYRAIEAESILYTYKRLGLLERLDSDARDALVTDASAGRVTTMATG